MDAELSYPEIGATAGELPPGYHHVFASAEVGHGENDFEAAASALFSWDMHRRCGIRVLHAPPIEVGSDVEMRWLGRRIPCRVVDVVHEPHRRGFAYGTLPGHPEQGEERFVVMLEPGTAVVTAEIRAFSRPGSWSARLAGPIGRTVQRWMTRRYLEALRPR